MTKTELRERRERERGRGCGLAMGACGDGSREHISKVCSQLIIGMPPLLHHEEKDEVGSKAGLLSRRRTCTVIDRAGAIYGSRQIAKRTTGTGRTWLSMLCVLRPSVAPLCLCLPSLQSTLHVTLALITKIFEGPLPPAFFLFFSLSLSRGKELRNYSCRDAYREGGYEDYPKVGWSVVKGDRL